ncbi:hypothetical protein [Rhodococcus globerulus]|uniref:Uncharacterized protein n=1 Tax=Rhodococcus globerulus TaxID=33008 RepID=A0ABU4BS57_RHOGO|nr:hypothetical protein [Rhodococcus globerulus]MDV6267052.1 hypothetical protein [Rhodococcus globerulus]
MSETEQLNCGSCKKPIHPTLYGVGGLRWEHDSTGLMSCYPWQPAETAVVATPVYLGAS